MHQDVINYNQASAQCAIFTGLRRLIIAKLLSQEVVPMFGVPEALLSDQGMNLLSLQGVCKLLE